MEDVKTEADGATEAKAEAVAPPDPAPKKSKRRVTREGSEYPAFIDNDYPSTSQPETGGECLVFHPSMDEFRDFESYIRKVEAKGAHLKAGIAKIVPPKEWNPRPVRGNDFSDIQELFIMGPIQQEVVGEKGCYTQYNSTFKKKMKVQEFKKLAQNAKYLKPKEFKSYLECERYYWKHIRYHRPVYGADFHASLYDNDQVDIWNINSLPSILDILKEAPPRAPPAPGPKQPKETKAKTKAKDKPKKEEKKPKKEEKEKTLEISGVNNAYMYFGMWKASFAWHTEDMDLYSINYIHFGEPKFWYGISHVHRDKMDRLTEMLFPESKGQCKAFMRHKTHLVSPDLLQKHGIPYGTMVQKEGEIIITFPAGYHAGFNLGYNAAESTNFASDRWIEFGEKAVTCQCKNDSVRIYMGPFIKRFRPERWSQYKYWYEEPGKPVEREGKRAGGQPVLPALESPKFPGDELKQEYEHLYKWKPVNFYAEMMFNLGKAMLEPHCALCQYFVPVALLAKSSDLPVRSRKIISELAFARDPHSPSVVSAVLERVEAAGDTAGNAAHSLRTTIKEDMVLQCGKCCVTVHASCYGELDVKEEDRLQWECARCAYAGQVPEAAEEGLDCVLCPLRAGPMQVLAEEHRSKAGHRQFAHLLCTLFDHDKARFADEVTKRPILLVQEEEKEKEAASSGGSRRSARNGGGGEAANGKAGSESPPRVGGEALTDPDDPDRVGNSEDEVDEEELLPELEPPKECSFCHGEDGVLVKCAHPECTPANLFHVPCGRVIGANFEARDFPQCVAAVCGVHDARSEGDGLSELQKNDHVVTWLDGGADVQRGKIKSVSEDTFCVVDFDDGSFSSDLYPRDIVECQCEASGCKGAHQSGSRVRIRWTDGGKYFGTFRRAYKSRTYKVTLFGTGAGLSAAQERGEEDLVDCCRSELYGPQEVLPPQVEEKLAMLERREWKRKRDREQKREKYGHGKKKRPKKASKDEDHENEETAEA